MRSEAERELTLSIAALGALLVLTALVAINLLQRMTPALADVLEENVQSMDAAGDMLSSLAAARLPEPEALAARRRFRAALDDAARNLSEPEEAALIDELRGSEASAFRGEPLALQRALRALEALGRVNRAAAQRANAEAKRLGTAGAWVVALLGVLGFGANLLLARRLARRLLLPLHELSRVLTAVENGDRLQRCATRGTFARHHELLARLNRLLDDRLVQTDAQGAKAEGSGVLPWLLDSWEGALVLLDAEGRVLSASRAALELLASERGPSLREAMNHARRGGRSEGVSTLRRSDQWVLLALTPAPDASPVVEELRS
jgi:hypothetical protein